MEEKKTSTFSNGLLWFGAAVSIAEILAGTFIAPLGLAKGLSAVLLGHAIGCAMMYLAGLIGGRTGMSAMETVRLSFGRRGSVLFSALNVLQLVGWTAVMTESGAAAASAAAGVGAEWIWGLVIAALIVVWLLVGLKNLGPLNTVAMGALFILTAVMSTVIFRSRGGYVPQGSISFGAAVELSAAMPLSWLPLVSDYTRAAKKPAAASLAGSAVYFLTSCWMYAIGMGAAIFTGESDIAKIMVAAGLGLAGLIIVIFATVTTTFLDVYSAGVSSGSISKRLREKPVAIAVCVVGALLAIFTPTARYESFLYLIGSVFAPMTAILIADWFILKSDSSGKSVDIINIALWAAGFILYRIFMRIDTPVGNTLPVMVIIAIARIIIHKGFGGKKDARSKT